MMHRELNISDIEKLEHEVTELRMELLNLRDLINNIVYHNEKMSSDKYGPIKQNPRLPF